MNIHLIRASHANEFELQNYAPLTDKHNIQVITSHNPLTNITLPTIQLWSPTDLPNFLLRRQLLNRLIGGEQWLPNLRKHIQKGDIAHTAETYTPYTHQAVQLRKAGVINYLICTCWETIPHSNEKFARLRRWKQDAYKHVDIFHTPTARAHNALIAEGVNKSKIQVIPYGVDLTRFKPKLTNPVRQKPRNRPLILTVARLVKEKGMAEIDQIAQSLPQYDFRIIGSGNYHFHATNITTATISYDQIHTAYQQADIFLFPSRTTTTWEEQYGMALIETMACGLPIVTTDSGAIPEIMEQAGIILSESNFATSAIHEIGRILTTPKLATQLSSLSLFRAHKHYNRAKVAKKLNLLYYNHIQ